MVRIIVLIVNVFIEDKNVCLEVGMNVYLSKFICKQVLFDCIVCEFVCV